MTVLEVIQRSSEFLARKGVDSPRLQVELLLAHVLEVPRLKLYLDFERSLTQAQADRVRGLIQRRGQREPLQHLVGTVSFCGLELAVSPDALIPRPETELLAERAWQYLQGLAEKDGGTPVALDVGTGSGCLAIALALRCPRAQIHAVDISDKALALARSNAGRHQVTDRIQFYAGDGFGPLASDLRFDLLVSNPPYIPSGQIAALQPEVRDHDPQVALDGGPDGLDFYRRLAWEARPFLRPGSPAMLELGDGQAEDVARIFHEQRWVVSEVVKDLSGHARILIAHGPV